MNNPPEESLNKNDIKNKKQANKKDQKKIDVPCKSIPPFANKKKEKKVDVPPKSVPLLSSSLAAGPHVAVVPHDFHAVSLVATLPSTKVGIERAPLLSSVISQGKEDGNKPIAAAASATGAPPLIQSPALIEYTGFVSRVAVSPPIIGGPNRKHAL